MPWPVVHDGFRSDLEAAAKIGEPIEIHVPGERIRVLVLAVSDHDVLVSDGQNPHFIPLIHVNRISAVPSRAPRTRGSSACGTEPLNGGSRRRRCP
jgi:hypothetical protein